MSQNELCWGCGPDFLKFWDRVDLTECNYPEADGPIKVCPDCYLELFGPVDKNN